MARIPQASLFSWKEIEASSDLVRLGLVLSVIPDESLMQKLERARGKGRNDYPVRAMWNALLAGVVFQHPSAAALIRELRRNRELADRCGFDPFKGLDGICSEDAFGRFLGQVIRHREAVVSMFETVVSALLCDLPDLGRTLALDSKAIASFGRAVKDEKRQKTPDGRRDLDANVGVKTYKGTREDGSVWKKVVSWFGYKLHLVVDSKYEIPLGFSVSRASCSDVVEGRRLVPALLNAQPEVASRARELAADRAYDCGDFNAELYDQHGIRPVIDARRCWKNELTRPLDPDRADTIVYDERGWVLCVCPWSGGVREMAFMGFEKDRKTLKFRCPAAIDRTEETLQRGFLNQVRVHHACMWSSVRRPPGKLEAVTIDGRWRRGGAADHAIALGGAGECRPSGPSGHNRLRQHPGRDLVSVRRHVRDLGLRGPVARARRL